ncbi:MAG: hypothetical protein KVP17_000061 [Porospora cf. gigantea B]|uniref:uncharacterized protein n=2 Tax=Porospora cf. gigantea B TaxID=2853592 RepID=UPI003571889E|nr:MAG: hypothetical protein KVP17_000061 [Porospora cf. gigantea B]
MGAVPGRHTLWLRLLALLVTGYNSHQNSSAERRILPAEAILRAVNGEAYLDADDEGYQSIESTCSVQGVRAFFWAWIISPTAFTWSGIQQAYSLFESSITSATPSPYLTVVLPYIKRSSELSDLSERFPGLMRSNVVSPEAANNEKRALVDYFAQNPLGLPVLGTPESFRVSPIEGEYSAERLVLLLTGLHYDMMLSLVCLLLASDDPLCWDSAIDTVSVIADADVVRTMALLRCLQPKSQGRLLRKWLAAWKGDLRALIESPAAILESVTSELVEVASSSHDTADEKQLLAEFLRHAPHTKERPKPHLLCLLRIGERLEVPDGPISTENPIWVEIMLEDLATSAATEDFAAFLASALHNPAVGAHYLRDRIIPTVRRRDRDCLPKLLPVLHQRFLAVCSSEEPSLMVDWGIVIAELQVDLMGNAEDARSTLKSVVECLITALDLNLTQMTQPISLVAARFKNQIIGRVWEYWLSEELKGSDSDWVVACEAYLNYVSLTPDVWDGRESLNDLLGGHESGFPLLDSIVSHWLHLCGRLSVNVARQTITVATLRYVQGHAASESNTLVTTFSRPRPAVIEPDVSVLAPAIVLRPWSSRPSICRQAAAPERASSFERLPPLVNAFVACATRSNIPDTDETNRIVSRLRLLPGLPIAVSNVKPDVLDERDLLLSFASLIASPDASRLISRKHLAHKLAQFDNVFKCVNDLL